MAYQVGPYTWFGKTSKSPGKKAGWYSGTQFITTDWKDPATKEIYTETGLSALLQASTAEPTTPVTEQVTEPTPTTPSVEEQTALMSETPTFEEISVPAPAVTPAPTYEISPEQKAWEETYGGKLTE